MKALIFVVGKSSKFRGPAMLPAFTSVAKASAILRQSWGSGKKFVHLVTSVPGGSTPESAPCSNWAKTALSRGMAACSFDLSVKLAIFSFHTCVKTLGRISFGRGKCGKFVNFHSSLVNGLS